jgi:hypothetical protein
MGFFCFHFLCAEFLEESFGVVSWWSYIVLVSAYHRRLLLFHLFSVFLGRICFTVVLKVMVLFSADSIKPAYPHPTTGITPQVSWGSLT